MGARSWIVNRLRGDATFTGILGTVEGVAPAGRIVSSGSIGIPGTTNAEIKRPFVVVRANLAGRALSGADKRYPAQPWMLWMHDSPGSYEANIAPLLRRAAVLLDGQPSVDMGDGEWLISCAWEVDSPDLYDDGLGTATRYSSYRLVTRVG